MESLETKIIKFILDNNLYSENELKKSMTCDLFEKYLIEKKNKHKINSIKFYKNIINYIIDFCVYISLFYLSEQKGSDIKIIINNNEATKIYEEIYEICNRDDRDDEYPPEIRLLIILLVPILML